MAQAQSQTTEETNTATEKCPALGGIVPYLSVSNASKAAEFYCRAFGATEVFRHPVDESGRTMHIHLHLNGNSLMLSDAYPEAGHPLKEHQGYSLLLTVEDIDTLFQRVVDAGGTVALPVQKMFWGDRYGQVRDPFGVLWAMNSPSKD